MNKDSILVTTPVCQEEIYFNDGIISCTGSTCRVQNNSAWCYIGGFMLGWLIISALSYYIMFIGNYKIIDDDYECMISREGFRKLHESGMSWDVESRDWVTSGKKFVTKLSPNPQDPLE